MDNHRDTETSNDSRRFGNEVARLLTDIGRREEFERLEDVYTLLEVIAEVNRDNPALIETFFEQQQAKLAVGNAVLEVLRLDELGDDLEFLKENLPNAKLLVQLGIATREHFEDVTTTIAQRAVGESKLSVAVLLVAEYGADARVLEPGLSSEKTRPNLLREIGFLVEEDLANRKTAQVSELLQRASVLPSDIARHICTGLAACNGLTSGDAIAALGELGVVNNPPGAAPSSPGQELDSLRMGEITSNSREILTSWSALLAKEALRQRNYSLFEALAIDCAGYAPCRQLLMETLDSEAESPGSMMETSRILAGYRALGIDTNQREIWNRFSSRMANGYVGSLCEDWEGLKNDWPSDRREEVTGIARAAHCEALRTGEFHVAEAIMHQFAIAPTREQVIPALRDAVRRVLDYSGAETILSEDAESSTSGQLAAMMKASGITATLAHISDADLRAFVQERVDDIRRAAPGGARFEELVSKTSRLKAEFGA